MEFTVPIAITSNAISPERTPPARNNDRVGPQRKAKRQPYTLVACDECKRRKVKFSGETPCNRCARQKDVNCVYEQRRFPDISTPEGQKSLEKGERSPIPIHSADRHHLWPLSRTNAAALLESLREEILLLYPFIDLQELQSLNDRVYAFASPGQSPAVVSQDLIWDSLDDIRNVEFLKVVLACALASKGYAEQDPSQRFATEVEKKSFARLRGLEVDLKDLAIATVLSIYKYHCDNVKLAWRSLAAATKLALELGLHRRGYQAVNDPTMKQTRWAKKLFWCVYVLDRKFSFMSNLPFSIHDEELDFNLLQSDISEPNLKRQVVYGQIGGKILPAVPRFGETTEDLDDNTRTHYGRSIDLWTDTAIAETTLSQSLISAVSTAKQRNAYHLSVYFQVLGNQMRLSLYKSSLYTPTNVLKLQKFACLAIRHVTETIRLLDQLRDGFIDLYEYHALDYKSFIISALASLCLAIRNSPYQFSSIVSEYWTGLKLLKSSFVPPIHSENLSKTIQTLENAINISMLSLPDVFGCRFPPYVNFTAPPPSTERNNSSEEQAEILEYNNMDLASQHNAFALTAPVSIMAISPSTHLYCDFAEGLGAFMAEKSKDQTAFNGHLVNDFAIDDPGNLASEQGIDVEWTTSVNMSLEEYFSEL